MTKNIFLGVLLLAVFSCNKNETDDSIKQGKGDLFVSGAIYGCAVQIRLDSKDTITISAMEINTLKSGDRVSVKYKEIGKNKYCTSYTDCEVIELRKIK